MLLDRRVGDLLDEIRAPVPLVAGRVHAVERRLDHRQRHRRDTVEQRRPERARLLQRGRVLVADLAPNDTAHLAKVELLGERRAGRDAQEREKAAQLVRLLRDELAVPGEHLRRVADVVEHRAGEHVLHVDAAERERRDDAEVASAAA